MPMFLDYHAMPAMPPEQMKKMTDQLKATKASRKADSSGVVLLNVYMAHGEAWGISEAPNAEAIMKSHAALGIKIKASDVVELTSVI